MSISTQQSIRTPTQITNPFIQEPKPPSFWQQIKFVCNKIFYCPLLSNKTKFKVYENPIYISNKVIVNRTHIPKISNSTDNHSISPDITQKNKNAIKDEKEITNKVQQWTYQLNELDKAIRLHPEFTSTEGIFRLSGKKADMNNIFEHLNSGKSPTQEFIDENNISLSTITLAYKELFGQIMEKQNYSAYFLDKSPDQALADAHQNQQDVITFMNKRGITGEKEKNILAKTKDRINREMPPLAFNMLISLFADIAKNPATKMDAKNLAICVAPRLLAEQFKTTSPENISLNNRMINFIETLIHTKLHA